MSDSNASGDQIVHGRCLCGKIQYEVQGQPLSKVLCHCGNCQRSTGSTFMANNIYLKTQLKITQGDNEADLRVYKDNNTDSGYVHNRQFCATCGSQLFVTNDGNSSLTGVVVIAIGTLDLTSGEWAPAQEFYCKRRLDWLPKLDGTQAFDGMT